MQRGELALVADWSPAQLIDALHKLCHDLMARGVGAQPRYFVAEDLPAPPTLRRLKDWTAGTGSGKSYRRAPV